MPKPTVASLRDLLDYDPETGSLRWRPRHDAHFAGGRYAPSRMAHIYNRNFAGKEAFTAKRGGYRIGRVCGYSTSAHIVAWAIHYGDWPNGPLDHINGDRADNRISNLRLATAAQNAANRKSHAGTSSRYRGVYWRKDRNRWVSIFNREYLGYFADEEAAARAFDAAARAKHGEYARLNFP